MEDHNHDTDDDTSDDELFPDFDEADDRDGDPFSQIDPPAGNGDAPDWMETEETPSSTEPTDAADPDIGPDASSTDGFVDDQQEVTGPADISTADEMLNEEPAGDDPFEGDSPFKKVDTETIDEEALWEEIQSDEPDATADSTDAIDETIGEVVVSKSRFCQQCEHFADPPEIGCTHDGTEIIEFVGVDDVRLRDCPVVANERELGHDIE